MNTKIVYLQYPRFFYFKSIITIFIVAKMKNSASSPALKTLKPVMVFCYICGR